MAHKLAAMNRVDRVKSLRASLVVLAANAQMALENYTVTKELGYEDETLEAGVEALKRLEMLSAQVTVARDFVLGELKEKQV